jgi:hypothetical protein
VYYSLCLYLQRYIQLSEILYHYQRIIIQYVQRSQRATHPVQVRVTKQETIIYVALAALFLLLSQHKFLGFKRRYRWRRYYSISVS